MMSKYILITVSLLIFAGIRTSAEEFSYIIPDIGAPGMNTYVEIIAPVNAMDEFGTVGFYLNNPGDDFRIETVRASDRGKIVFGPFIVGWRGRLISTHVFVHPSLRPNSSYWADLNSEFRIPFRIYYNGNYTNIDTFYIVRPYNFGDLTGNPDRVLGEGSLGRRSRRGGMIVTSASFGAGTYTVSTNDCDPYTEGNQGYLPFILIAEGALQGTSSTVISVSANGKHGGPGGGGGGGNFCDAYIFNRDIIGQDGGNGFTGGGPGGRNNSGGGSDDAFKNAGTGTGTGGASLNGVAPPLPAAYEASGGGTGHPFGRSGEGCGDGYNCDPLGQYGGGSGYQQNQRGGAGGYRTDGNNTGTNNGGKIHGNSDGIPIAGGSGGASGNPRQPGACSGNGGGGGGAIRIVAESITRLQIKADGANGAFSSNGSGGSGSGGYIELGGKLKILNCNLSAAGGTNGGGRGLLRVETPFYLGMNYNPSGIERGRILTTDTSRYVYKKFTLTGSKNSNLDTVRLYMRRENGNWRLDTILYGLRSLDTWKRDYYLDGTDSIYYLCAVADRQFSSFSPFSYTPDITMSQAAANVFIKNKVPEIVSDTMFTMEIAACEDNSSDKVFMIYNTGDATLRLDFQSATFAKGGNGFELVSPKTETWVLPGDSVEVVVRYTYQTGQMGTVSDTLLISHNDILAYNQPHKIAFTVKLLNLDFNVTNTSLVDIDTLYFDQVCYNETAEKRFWINNKSDIVLSVTQTGPNSPNFVLRGSTNLSIGVNDYEEVTIEFRPDRSGMFNSMLIIASDTCNSLVDTLYLSGEAVSGEFSYQLPVDFELDTLNIYENCVGGIYSGHFLVRNRARQRITYPTTFSFKTQDYDLDAHSSGSVNTNYWDTVYFDLMPLREGIITAEFVLETNECGSFTDTLIILCKGVTAELSYSGDNIFNITPVDFRDTITVWLHNNGTADVYIESLEPLSPPFNYVDVIPPLPQTLSPGDSIRIDIEFYPRAEGEYKDTVSTVQILKDSTCLDNKQFAIRGISSDDDLILSTDTLRFGVLEFCDQKEDSLIITNPSSVTVKFSNARIAGPDASYFEISQSPLADTIPPNSQVVFFVRFRPRLGPDGVKVAQFLLDTDFPKEPTISVELRGTQENLKITMSPPELNFGSVPIGVQAVRTITLTNNGVLDQNLIDVKLSNPDMTATPKAAPLPGNGGSVDIDITFQPTVAGNYDTEIWFLFRKNCTDSISTNIYAEGREGEIIVSDSVVFDLLPPCADVIDSSLIVINSGASLVTIDSMIIVGPESNLFAFADTVKFPYVLDSAQTVRRTIVFTPANSSYGRKTAMVLTYTDGGGKTKIDTTYLRAEKRKFITLTPQFIDFGDVIVGRSKTLSYTIENRGNSSAIIMGIIAPAYNEFTLTPDPSGSVLSAGETMSFDIIFAPTVDSQYMDRFSVIAQYITKCEDTTAADLRGNGIAPVDTRFIIGTRNDVDPRLYEINIPIKAYIANDNTEISDLEFNAMISFNATLFAIKSFDMATIVKDSIANNTRFIRFSVQGMKLNADTGNVIATLRGRPLLGNATSTGINWNEFYWAEPEAFGQTDTVPGTLSIKVCEAGGQRLLNPGLPLTMSISPNPAGEVIGIKVTILEVGKHTIELYDLQGRASLIKEFDVTLNSQKEFEINYNVSGLPSGFYLIILKSPTDRVVQPLYIFK